MYSHTWNIKMNNTILWNNRVKVELNEISNNLIYNGNPKLYYIFTKQLAIQYKSKKNVCIVINTN